MRHPAIAALLVLVLAAVAGCTIAPSDPHLSVTVFQYRSDYAARQLQLEVHNDSDQDVTVTSAGFSSDYFTGPVFSRSTPSLVSAGVATDFPVVLPDGSCDSPAPKLAVVIEWVAASGETGTLRAEPRDTVGSIEMVHKQDCSRAAFEKIATITAAPALRYLDDGGKPIALLDITITPTGAPGSATLLSTQDTTLLAQREGQLRALNLTFTAASPVTTITLDYTPSRCEQHVVAEDKVGTLVPMHASAGDYQDAAFLVPVTDSVKREFYTWFAAYCGWS